MSKPRTLTLTLSQGTTQVLATLAEKHGFVNEPSATQDGGPSISELLEAIGRGRLKVVPTPRPADEKRWP
jgi:hypothetical protein